MALDLDAVTARVVDAIAVEAVDPVVVRFLLSRYAATAREDLAAIVGEALAQALARHAAASTAVERGEWLLLFADALAWSEDDRLAAAASAALAALDGAPLQPSIVEACLRASAALGDSARVGARIDDLERLVAARYEPGEGIGAQDEFGVASALLTAYEITGRVPYPMLAEELVRTAQRHGWRDDEIGAACEAAQVFCRLEALRADEAYSRAAVVAPEADYGGVAASLLARHAPHALDRARDAAAYGLALAQWLGLH